MDRLYDPFRKEQVESHVAAIENTIASLNLGVSILDDIDLSTNVAAARTQEVERAWRKEEKRLLSAIRDFVRTLPTAEDKST